MTDEFRVPDAFDDDGAVNMRQVDAMIAVAIAQVLNGLQQKSPVRYAAAVNVPSRVGIVTLDGHVPSSGDRVWLPHQSDGISGGLWIVSESGGWTRPDDFAIGMEFVGTNVFVESGNANANTLWWVNNTGQVGSGAPNIVKLP